MMLKKLSLFTVTVLAALNLHAQNSSDYDVSLKYGLTSLDNNDGWKFKYNTLAADATFNLGYEIKPRIDVAYVFVDDSEKWGSVSSLFQGALGVQYGKTFDMSRFSHELYLFGGLGYEYVADGHETFDSLPFFQGGIGAKYGLSERLNLLAEFKALQVFDSNNDSDDEDNEFSVMIGLNFPFGKTAQKPLQTKVEVLDSDDDGVDDKIDLCPNTPKGTKVDVNGCKMKEILPSKPAAPAPLILLDSDNDTITDDIDQCPHTPFGVKVDSLGCMEKMNLEINFESNAAEITKDSMPKIWEFATFLKNAPKDTIAIIEGYTDSSGDTQKNRALSSKRAFAVRKALIAAGVEKRRVRAYGRGDTNPIADNTTVEGRAKNRRIEATIKHLGEI